MSEQKRKHPRADFVVDVSLTFDDRSVSGTSRNISRGGIFIDAEDVPPFGGKAVLTISLPGVRETSQIPCIARWSKPGTGVGLQFEQLRAIEVWAINKIMRAASTS